MVSSILSDSPIAINVLDTKTVRLDVSASIGIDGDVTQDRRRQTVSGTNFNFDYVFGPDATQVCWTDAVANRIIGPGVLTIIAYGVDRSVLF